MHTRRLATFLLGVWLGGILLSVTFALKSSTVPDEILASPHPRVRELAKQTGEGNMRALLQHAAAEQQRAQSRVWDLFQLAAGAALVAYLLFGTHESSLPVALAGGMLAVAAAGYLLITPDRIGYGRGLDFLEAARFSNEQAKALLLERVHLAAEILKLALGGVLLARLLYRKPRRRLSRSKIDVVNHADHSHVDR